MKPDEGSEGVRVIVMVVVEVVVVVVVALVYTGAHSDHHEKDKSS